MRSRHDLVCAARVYRACLEEIKALQLECRYAEFRTNMNYNAAELVRRATAASRAVDDA